MTEEVPCPKCKKKFEAARLVFVHFITNHRNEYINIKRMGSDAMIRGIPGAEWSGIVEKVVATEQKQRAIQTNGPQKQVAAVKPLQSVCSFTAGCAQAATSDMRNGVGACVGDDGTESMQPNFAFVQKFEAVSTDQPKFPSFATLSEPMFFGTASSNQSVFGSSFTNRPTQTFFEPLTRKPTFIDSFPNQPTFVSGQTTFASATSAPGFGSVSEQSDFAAETVYDQRMNNQRVSLESHPLSKTPIYEQVYDNNRDDDALSNISDDSNEDNQLNSFDEDNHSKNTVTSKSRKRSICSNDLRRTIAPKRSRFSPRECSLERGSRETSSRRIKREDDREDTPKSGHNQSHSNLVDRSPLKHFADSSMPKVPCLICSASFPSADEVVKHETERHPLGRFKCTVCNTYHYSKPSDLINHVTASHKYLKERSSMLCSLCKGTFGLWNEYLEHIQECYHKLRLRHYREMPFAAPIRCFDCQNIFATCNAYDDHRERCQAVSGRTSTTAVYLSGTLLRPGCHHVKNYCKFYPSCKGAFCMFSHGVCHLDANCRLKKCALYHSNKVKRCTVCKG